MIEVFKQGLQKYPIGSDDRKWFVTWIIRYGQFGGYDGSSKFDIDQESTLAFCRQLLSHGTPAWQRLQAVRCLIAYRAIVLGENDGLLEKIRSTIWQPRNRTERRKMGLPNRRSRMGRRWLRKLRSERRFAEPCVAAE